MAAKYFALLTNLGAAKLSSMAALGEKLEITSMAVGDGGGVTPTPDQKQTKLVNEVRREALNSLSVSKDGDSQIIAEQIIPDSAGGWWIREIGLYDVAGDLIAIANCPETYKATAEEGSGRTQVIRMILTVSSTDAVTLKVDPSVVLASRQYVDDAVIEVKDYSDDLMKKHLGEDNPHLQYLLIDNALKEIADAGLTDQLLENLGLGTIGAAASKGVATNADMQTGTSTDLLPTVAAVISLFPVKTYTDSDYIRIPDRPGGLIIQWRKDITDGSSSGKLHTFPTPFPSQLLFVVPIDLTSSTSTSVAACAVDYDTSTLDAAKVYVSSGNSVFSMLAIGR